MKKHHLLFIALIISLIFGTYNYISLKSQKRTANEIFAYKLQQAQSYFGADYKELNIDDKNYRRIMASSSLSTAISVLNLTSYAHNENSSQLLVALDELNRCITEVNTFDSRTKAFTEKSGLIQKYLTNISTNPNDESSCKALFKLSNYLHDNLKDVLINYKGISPNWDIGYKIDGNQNKHETYYTFKYIGKNADSVKEVNYSIDSTNEGEEGKFTMDKTKVYKGKLRLTVGLPKPTDRDITFKIKWNGKKEVLILKRSK